MVVTGDKRASRPTGQPPNLTEVSGPYQAAIPFLTSRLTPPYIVCAQNWVSASSRSLGGSPSKMAHIAPYVVAVSDLSHTDPKRLLLPIREAV